MYKCPTKNLYVLVYILIVIDFANCKIATSTHDEALKLNEKTNFEVLVTNFSRNDVKLQFIVQYDDIAEVYPKYLILNSTKEAKYTVELKGIGAGNTVVYANLTESDVSVDDVFVRLNVFKNQACNTISLVIGWVYFLAWSVSFYPQIIINYKRKSVVGLNFDYLMLNVVGFSLYAIFNIGLFAIPEIKAEYFERYPRGLNPVQVNDIVFAVHAALVCLVTIGQCFIYERGEQKVSTTAKCILGCFLTFLLISMILGATNVIHWLDFLYFCSYVKLTITLIKYVPQAYMNYKRKSTVGWSIENIFLDFTGGMLSMLQMILISYNYDDWASIFGDPTKFGLGLFSVVFDIFFIIQHYVIYRHSSYEER